MAASFTAEFLDSVSDSILRTMFLFTEQVADRKPTQREIEVLGLDADYQLADFCQVVKEAFDRRFGPVSGY